LVGRGVETVIPGDAPVGEGNGSDAIGVGAAAGGVSFDRLLICNRATTRMAAAASRANQVRMRSVRTYTSALQQNDSDVILGGWGPLS
jgi:hypothetical protein